MNGSYGINIFPAALVAVLVVSAWIVFRKAGQPGWFVLVPFLNLYLCLKIAGKPGWWFFLWFVPVANLVVLFLSAIAFAVHFGRSELFGLGLVFLPWLFLPVLAFGDAKYVGPKVELFI